MKLVAGTGRKLRMADWLGLLLVAALALTGCRPQGGELPVGDLLTPLPALVTPASTEESSWLTPLPSRLPYQPGELVDYLAQTGDTLSALAAHFNTSVDEILAANSFIPADASTMPPGMPMRIPIYYAPFWGSPYQIIPDSLFINGPAQIGFNTPEYVANQPGWLKDYSAYAGGANRSGAEIVDYVALNFSISPRLLLALLEYQAGALSQPTLSLDKEEYPLGYADKAHHGVYLQLVWAANSLNNGYYGWRTGSLVSFQRQDGTMERPDPWQNSASVALQYYFAQLLSVAEYTYAISPQGFAQSYHTLFGNPWLADQAHIPGSLHQPDFILPFQPGKVWSLTGGPHTGWGSGEPWAALDFAPPAVIGGCVPSDEWATAVADGTIVRSETGTVVLDLDGDGDERTGWVVFYLHVGSAGRVQRGVNLQMGDPIGHPSCEGGSSTGTHIHMARKYNGEWLPAAGTLAFNLEGWIAQNGSQAYQGSLKRYGSLVTACLCSNKDTFIQSEYMRP